MGGGVSAATPGAMFNSRDADPAVGLHDRLASSSQPEFGRAQLTMLCIGIVLLILGVLACYGTDVTLELPENHPSWRSYPLTFSWCSS